MTRVSLLSLAISVLLLALLVPTPTAVAVGGTVARVIGTAETALLACPQPDCNAVGMVPLGKQVLIKGDLVDGFYPVLFQRKTGFVAKDYLYAPSGALGIPNFERGEPGCDRVALIFNIGSGYEPAMGTLTGLAAADIPATVFVMGWWADRHPELVQRILDDGFTVGSHGYNPPELTTRGDGDIAYDLQAATAAIETAGGEPITPLFTPYADDIDDRVRSIAASQGLLPIGWDVSTGDWAPDATAELVYQRVIDQVTDGSIIELHIDSITSFDSTAVAVPWIVESLTLRGYRFVTIPEMIAPCP